MRRVFLIALLCALSAGCVVHTSVGDFDCEPTKVDGVYHFELPVCTRLR